MQSGDTLEQATRNRRGGYSNSILAATERSVVRQVLARLAERNRRRWRARET